MPPHNKGELVSTVVTESCPGSHFDAKGVISDDIIPFLPFENLKVPIKAEGLKAFPARASTKFHQIKTELSANRTNCVEMALSLF